MEMVSWEAADGDGTDEQGWDDLLLEEADDDLESDDEIGLGFRSLEHLSLSNADVRMCLHTKFKNCLESRSPGRSQAQAEPS
jgi:hypothetical protein